MKALASRFWPKVARGDGDECWVWTAAANTSGYGQFHSGKSQIKLMSHRVSYELTHGPIPEGMCVLHRCDNPRCVNPDHLWLGTHAENMADRDAKGRNCNAAKTHCIRGHPFAGANLYLPPSGRQRICRACKRKQEIDRQKRRRAA